MALRFSNMLEDEYGWKVNIEGGTCYRFRYSLDEDAYRKAFYFALTVGSLHREEILDIAALHAKERIVDTGVPGVFYRRGLYMKYIVILNGSIQEFPYKDGKGFVEACRVASSKLTEEVKYNLMKYEIKPILSFE